jgi:hypothetical protein
MINLSGKSFKNNLTGDVVNIIDSFENIAILQDKSRVDVRHLLSPGLFTDISSQSIQPVQNFSESMFNTVEVEEVKPENFFSNQFDYNSLADKIKSIPQHLIKDDPNAGRAFVRIEDPDGNPTSTAFDDAVRATNNESAIIQINPDDERAALAAKYGVVNPTESINKQNEAFTKLLGESNEEGIQVVEVNREEEINNWNNEQIKVIQPIQQEDPILRMFKGVKRSLDFKVSIDINNKIPRVDFIEMMEDSYETSIIDFLANEFTNNIINNPVMIKEMIKSKITDIVYDKKYNRKERTTTKKDKVTDSIISDSVTVVTKIPRATRNKKEVVK